MFKDSSKELHNFNLKFQRMSNQNEIGRRSKTLVFRLDVGKLNLFFF